MTDLKEELQRAARHAPLPDHAWADLVDRRARARRAERITSMVVALAVATAVVGGSVFALRSLGSSGRIRAASGGGDGSSSFAPAVGAGEYFFLQTTVFGGGDGATWVQRTWWSPDGSGELRFQADRADKYTPWPSPGVYGPGEFPVEADLSSLSTDPSVLHDQLVARSAADGGSPEPDVTPGGGLPLETGQLWRAIRDLLMRPNALPQLRAALFDVAAGLEGVTRDDDAVDPAGRAAIRLDVTSEGVHWHLFFDPRYHQLMAESEGVDEPHPFMLVESGITDARGEEPTAQELLFPRGDPSAGP